MEILNTHNAGEFVKIKYTTYVVVSQTIILSWIYSTIYFAIYYISVFYGEPSLDARVNWVLLYEVIYLFVFFRDMVFSCIFSFFLAETTNEHAFICSYYRKVTLCKDRSLTKAIFMIPLCGIPGSIMVNVFMKYAGLSICITMLSFVLRVCVLSSIINTFALLLSCLFDRDTGGELQSQNFLNSTKDNEEMYESLDLNNKDDSSYDQYYTVISS